MFSEWSPAEIHEDEGNISKVLVYVPQGFSSIEFAFQDDPRLFRRGQKMILQIGNPYVEKETYQMALIETPQNNITTITVQDFSGDPLTSGITKTDGQFSIYRAGK